MTALLPLSPEMDNTLLLFLTMIQLLNSLSALPLPLNKENGNKPSLISTTANQLLKLPLINWIYKNKSKDKKNLEKLNFLKKKPNAFMRPKKNSQLMKNSTLKMKLKKKNSDKPLTNLKTSLTDLNNSPWRPNLKVKNNRENCKNKLKFFKRKKSVLKKCLWLKLKKKRLKLNSWLLMNKKKRKRIFSLEPLKCLKMLKMLKLLNLLKNKKN